MVNKAKAALRPPYKEPMIKGTCRKSTAWLGMIMGNVIQSMMELPEITTLKNPFITPLHLDWLKYINRKKKVRISRICNKRT